MLPKEIQIIIDNKDFKLTDQHLSKINRIATEVAKAHGETGIPESQSLKVIFEFSPLGTDVYVSSGNKLYEV